MNYLQFVKQWNAEKGLKWNDAIREARKDYYEAKNRNLPQRYKKEPGNEKIFDTLKRNEYDVEDLLFQNDKKADDLYLVEAEHLSRDDYNRLLDALKNREMKKSELKEVKALMNLPIVEAELRSKIRKRPLGIRQVSKIKKNVEKATTKIKDKKKVRKLQQQILSLNRMKGLKKILNK